MQSFQARVFGIVELVKAPVLPENPVDPVAQAVSHFAGLRFQAITLHPLENAERHVDPDRTAPHIEENSGSDNATEGKGSGELNSVRERDVLHNAGHLGHVRRSGPKRDRGGDGPAADEFSGDRVAIVKQAVFFVPEFVANEGLECSARAEKGSGSRPRPGHLGERLVLQDDVRAQIRSRQLGRVREEAFVPGAESRRVLDPGFIGCAQKKSPFSSCRF